MDFTREPIVETVITPKEGCKIVVRSSKSAGQEEYFVDALEVVSFGSALFFRSLEKPKAFLVPASDYEILEVREARMVLKNVGLDRSIKIGGGREQKQVKEKEPVIEKQESSDTEETATNDEQGSTDARSEKKRDRRRQQRRRRGVRDEAGTKEETASSDSASESVASESASNGEVNPSEDASQTQSTTSFMSALLPPPPTLISETIGRYKENVLFKNAFYTKEENQEEKKEGTSESAPASEAVTSHDESLPVVEMQPMFATFWDDMNQPSMPPLPYVEPVEEEKSPVKPPEPPAESEEK